MKEILDHCTEDQYYNELIELARELRYPVPVAMIETEVTDRNGNVVNRRKQRAHSWVRNFYNLLICQFASCNPTGTAYSEGHITLYTTSASLMRSTSSGVRISTIHASAGTYNRSIAVGMATDPWHFTDYALWLPIIHGTDTDQLSYSESVVPVCEFVSDGTFRKVLRRYFNNNSPSTVDVGEIGIIAGVVYAAGSTSYSVLICRDVINPPDVIDVGGQYRVDYTLEVNIPTE